MIFDGLWKWELQKHYLEIFFWHKIPIRSDFVKHRITRAVLYSSLVIRKVIEDELEAKKELINDCINEFSYPVSSALLKIIEYPYTNQNGFLVRGKLFTDNYGQGKVGEIDSKKICNSLIHSYIWEVIGYSDENYYSGFLVSSDYFKEKYIYYVSFEEWNQLLKTAITKAVF